MENWSRPAKHKHNRGKEKIYRGEKVLKSKIGEEILGGGCTIQRLIIHTKSTTKFPKVWEGFC